MPSATLAEASRSIGMRDRKRLLSINTPPTF